MNKKEIVTKENLREVLNLLDSMEMKYWIDGGWGVDILLGKQNREHRDIDVDFDGEFTKALLYKLKEIGYEIVVDWSPSRIELYHPELGYIDIHPLIINKDGSARQADLQGGWYEFEEKWFSTAVFEGRVIPCISAKAQKLFHSGYELREVDKIDMKNLEKLKRAIYLITGVMGSGKSTVAQLLASKIKKGVHLRGDIFRKMIVSGRADMSVQPSEEAVSQLHLRYRLAADAAKTYYDNGFSVVLQDNYYGKELTRILSMLKDYSVNVIVLCPDVETVKKREKMREKIGYTGFSVETLHADFMRETPKVGFWLDTSEQSPEQSVQDILLHFDE